MVNEGDTDDQGEKVDAIRYLIRLLVRVGAVSRDFWPHVVEAEAFVHRMDKYDRSR
jgi:hypothetical protein